MSLTREREEQILKTIKENFPSDVKTANAPRRSRVDVTVTPEKISEIAIFLRDKLGFDYPAGVSAVDYNTEARMEVVYHLSSIIDSEQRDIVINLKESIPRNNSRVPSLVKVWPGVENYERESMEMFGIQFTDHPRPEKLFLNDNWDGPPPLRKEIKFPTD